MHVVDQLRDRQVNGPPGVDAGDLIRELGDESLEDVGAGKNHRDRFAHEPVFPAPGGVEHRLQLMGELLEHHELHHPDVPLERVERPEEGVEGGGISGIDLENEHPLLDVLQQILGLCTEDLEHLGIGVGGHHPHRLLGEECGR